MGRLEVKCKHTSIPILMAHNITTIHFSKSVPVIQLVMVVCGLTVHICNILVSGILLYVQVTRDCNSIAK